MIFQTISILLPTRGRSKQLDKTIKSIRRNADQPSKVEIIFRCDVDDQETLSYLSSNNEIFIAGPREKGYASLPKFMNQCARLSTGDIIMMFNDDAIIETKGWDSKLISCANKFPDGIFNIGVNTGLNDNLFPFSIVSRVFMNALGYVNDERLLFSDIFLLDVLEGFERTIRLKEVMFKHNWAGCETTDKTRLDAQIHENSIVFDGTSGDSKNPKKNWQKSYLNLHQNSVNEAIRIIKDKVYNADQNLDSTANFSLGNTEIVREFKLDCLHNNDCEQLKMMLERIPESFNMNALVLPVYENCYNGESWSEMVVWSKIFSSVYGVSNVENIDIYNYIPFHRGRIYSGLIDDALTRYRLRDICAGIGTEMYGKFTVLVLNDSRYDHSLANYFVFKKILTVKSLIIFTHNSDTEKGAQNDRLVNDLASGILDSVEHKFESFRNAKTGAGFTVELCP